MSTPHIPDCPDSSLVPVKIGDVVYCAVLEIARLKQLVADEVEECATAMHEWQVKRDNRLLVRMGFRKAPLVKSVRELVADACAGRANGTLPAWSYMGMAFAGLTSPRMMRLQTFAGLTEKDAIMYLSISDIALLRYND